MGLTRRDAIRAAGVAALPLAATEGRAATPRGRYLILACDGGVRGYLTARLIKELDQATGFLRQVDLFAGTSTGGIIALGLADDRVGIDRLVELYQTKAREIFSPANPPELANPSATVAESTVKDLVRRRWPGADWGSSRCGSCTRSSTRGKA
ncbi:MAG TPA: patatin-like phospholipase family protein [Urbifossiella sp.]|nr:patatin-like phospholipase family protein [Urbifossiella sp.]